MSDVLIAEIYALTEEVDRLRAEIAVLKTQNAQLARELAELKELAWGREYKHPDGDCDI